MIRGYKNCRLVLSNSVIDSGFIRFHNGLIESFGNLNDAGQDTLKDLTDVSGNYVMPGFIDLHCHGGAGSDVMDATFDDLNTISLFHAKGGTTGFLATTTSESTESILGAIENVKNNKERISGAQILGVHLEGPYFNIKKKGCHLEEHVRIPRKSEYEKILNNDLVRLITLAPEIEGASELIKYLVKKNITVSLGHSEASYDQVVKAINLGASHVTHMYCAMSGVIKTGVNRSGGMIEATLLKDALTTELIADGKHLPNEIIRLVLKAKGTDKVCVVTDAMRGAGMPDGIYTFGSKSGTKAEVVNGVAVTMDRTGYASSVFRMIDMFHHMVKTVGIDIVTASALFSKNPSKIIRKDNLTGNIDKGKQADIIVLNNDLELKQTIIKGNPI